MPTSNKNIIEDSNWLCLYDKLNSYLIAKGLELKIKHMELQQESAEKPHFFRGAGKIWVNNDGKIQFAMDVTENNMGMQGWMKKFNQSSIGKLYSDNEYYSLSATDENGTSWSTERIIPAFTWSMNGSVKVEGSCSTIETSARQKEPRHYIKMIFIGENDVPSTVSRKYISPLGEISYRRSARFMAAGIQIAVTPYDNYFTVEAVSNQPLPDFIELRISEAVKFCLGQANFCRTYIKFNNETVQINLRSERQFAKQKSMVPLRATEPSHNNDFWRMFANYLEYVIANTAKAHWNVCSMHLFNAAETSAGNYDSWIMGLSVAIEGTSSTISAKLKKEERKELEALRDSLLEFIAVDPTLAKHTPRISNLLGMMFHERVQDRLKLLVESGKAYREDAAAWSKMRNKYLHPKSSHLKMMATGDYQEVIDLMFKMNILLHHIIFYLIKYKGKFTDYGTTGFPTRDYPLRIKTRKDSSQPY